MKKSGSTASFPGYKPRTSFDLGLGGLVEPLTRDEERVLGVGGVRHRTEPGPELRRLQLVEQVHVGLLEGLDE